MSPTRPSSDTEFKAAQPASVLCIGLPLLDICFFGDKSFLAENGLNANDACVVGHERYITIYNALKSRYNVESHIPGGSCQNVARTAQWLLNDHPGSVTYMGAIGCDLNGEILREKVKEIGVNGVYQMVNSNNTPTGTCLAILNGNDRSLVAHLGAAEKFSFDHIESNWSLVENAQFIYIEGFFLQVCFEACMALAKHVALNPRKRLLFNLSAEFVATQQKDLILQILPYVDVLLGNGDEASAFGKALGVDSEDLVDLAKTFSGLEKIREELNRIVVITQGAKSVVAATSHERAFLSRVPLLAPQQIVDTTGAGDAFVGGFLAQMVIGQPLEECIRFGSDTSAIVIQRLGCTFPAERPKVNILKQ